MAQIELDTLERHIHVHGYSFNDETSSMCEAIISYPVGKEYTSVCGRIKAYESGVGGAFFQYHANNASINQNYLTGFSLTHGGNLENSNGTEEATHIWSFTTGVNTAALFQCPCDSGQDAPPFVGEDYFCERGTNTISNPRNPLWDGAVCKDDGNDCCSRINHPYFIKHLLTPTTNNIDLRVCYSLSDLSHALEIIELYVK